MTRTTLYLSALALAILYGGYGLLTVDRRSDAQQLRSLVERAATAVQKRDVGGAISCVSRSYKDTNGLNYDRLRLAAAQAMRMEEPYTAGAEIRHLTVDGRDAAIEIHAWVASRNGQPIYNRNVTLVLRKESGRHMMLIPVKVWRVVSSQNLGIDCGI